MITNDIRTVQMIHTTASAVHESLWTKTMKEGQKSMKTPMSNILGL